MYQQAACRKDYKTYLSTYLLVTSVSSQERIPRKRLNGAMNNGAMNGGFLVPGQQSAYPTGQSMSMGPTGQTVYQGGVSLQTQPVMMAPAQVYAQPVMMAPPAQVYAAPQMYAAAPPPLPSGNMFTCPAGPIDPIGRPTKGGNVILEFYFKKTDKWPQDKSPDGKSDLSHPEIINRCHLLTPDYAVFEHGRACESWSRCDL